MPGDRLVLLPESFVPDDGDGTVFGRVQHGRHAVATDATTGGRGLVHYLPALVRDPAVLIGTFAHELGHRLIGLGSVSPPPIEGADEAESLIDVAAVYLGFGVFLANQAFSLQQHGDAFSQGWQRSRRGYLPESDLVFGLAIFHAVKDLDPEPALASLKPHRAGPLRRTFGDLTRWSDRVRAIRAKEPRFNAP